MPSTGQHYNLSKLQESAHSVDGFAEVPALSWTLMWRLMLFIAQLESLRIVQDFRAALCRSLKNSYCTASLQLARAHQQSLSRSPQMVLTFATHSMASFAMHCMAEYVSCSLAQLGSTERRNKLERKCMHTTALTICAVPVRLGTLCKRAAWAAC